MGTRVDFYILSTSSEEERHLYACRLIEKAFHQGQRLYIHVTDEAHARIIDDLLWAFRDTSFVPHVIGNDNTQPITIGFADRPVEDRIVINLSDKIPLISEKMTRLIEILPKDGPITLAGRERYKHYQQQQFEINTHKIGPKT